MRLLIVSLTLSAFFQVGCSNKSDIASEENCSAFGCWTGVYLEDVTEDSCVNDVAYGVESWAAVGYKVSSSTYKPYVWHSTDLSSWTSVEMEDQSVLGNTKDIIYDGTRWIAIGTPNSGPNTQTDSVRIWISMDLATWTPYVVESGIGNYVEVMQLYFDGTTYVAVGVKPDANVSSTSRAYVWYTTDPTGSWSGQEINQLQGVVQGVAKYGSDWVLVGYSGSSSNPYPHVWYSSTLGGAWNDANLGTISEPTRLMSVTVSGTDLAASGYFLDSADSNREKPIVWTTSDFLSWSSTQLAFDTGSWAEPQIFTNGIYWFARFTLDLWYSSDRSTWTRVRMVDEEWVSGAKIFFANSKWVASGCKEKTNGGAKHPRIWHKTQ